MLMHLQSSHMQHQPAVPTALQAVPWKPLDCTSAGTRLQALYQCCPTWLSNMLLATPSREGDITTRPLRALSVSTRLLATTASRPL